MTCKNFVLAVMPSEIGAALRKRFHVKFKANAAENRVHFRTLSSLADFIAAGLEGAADEKGNE